MSAIPVAGVGLGDQSSFGGLTRVQNAAATVAPQGWPSTKVGFQTAVFYAGQTGGSVLFAFDQPYGKPPTQNVSFVFSGDGLVTGVTTGTRTSFGAAAVANSAFNPIFSGWSSSQVATLRAWHSAPGVGGQLDIAFADPYIAQTPLNTPFYFGGSAVVTAVTLGDQLRFGQIEEVIAPLVVNPSGIESTATVGRPRAGATGDLEFSFVAPYTTPSPFNVPFYFGPGLTLTGNGFTNGRFGAASTRNLAFDTTPEGWESSQFGRSRYAFTAENGRNVDFSFAQSYVAPTPLNTPFYFAGLININVGGFDAVEFGITDVQNFIRYITPPSLPGTSYGQQQVRGRREVFPYGFDFTVWGHVDVYSTVGDWYGGIPPGEIGGFRVDYRIRPQAIAPDLQTSDFGLPGVSPQFVRPSGWTGAIGAVRFDQTLTTRVINLVNRGFTTTTIGGGLKVDPRFIYPQSFLATSPAARFGNARVVSNAIEAVGIPPGDFGTAEFSDGKQFITLTGMAPSAVQVSQPAVIGRWEFVRPSSFPTSSIVGDVAVRNQRRFVSPEGFDASEFPRFAPTVYNVNQLVLPFGFASPGPFFARPDARNTAWQIIPFTPIGPETFGPETSVGAFIRTIFPAALDSAVYGNFTVVNAARPVRPQGFEGTYGNPMVAYGRRQIRPVGFVSSLLGNSHEVTEGRRFVRDAGGTLMTGMSNGHLVESSIRMIDHRTFGQDMSQYGRPTVWFGVRSIAPQGFSRASPVPWLQFGGNIRVWFSVRYIQMDPGRDFMTFGTAGVRRNEFVVQPEPIVNERGTPDVQWFRRPIFPRQISPELQWGTAWISRSPRVITQFLDENGLALTTRVGAPWMVENRNKTIGTFGWFSSRFPLTTFVDNNARVISARGTDMAVFGTQFIGDRVRTLSLEGWQSTQGTRWHEVANYSLILELTGVPRGRMGVPFVWSNTQWVDLFGTNNNFIQWGDPFVAYAVRTISLERQEGELFSDGIPPGSVGTHYMDNYTRFIQPVMPELRQVGDQVFEVRRNIIHPWGNDMSLYGDATVRNVTPEVRVWGFQSSEFLNTNYVGLYTRTVDHATHSIPPHHQFLPRPVVQFRTRTLPVPGIDSLRIPLLHRVWLDVPDIPPRQEIFTYWIGRFDPVTLLGENIDPAGYGEPTVRSMPVMSGWTSSRFGGHSFRRQGISPIWDDFSSQFGLARLNPAQFIEGEGLSSDNKFGLPRLSPFVIYCRPDDPPRYKEGAPLGANWRSWVPIDTPTPGYQLNGRGGPDVQWGNTRVSTFANQRIWVHHNALGTRTNPSHVVSRFADVQNLRRWVVPEGIPPPRFGFPTLPTNIELLIVGWRSDIYGRADVVRGAPPPVTRTLSAQGHLSGRFGAQLIENQHRTIFPQGTLMTLWGNNSPMVHFPRRVRGSADNDFATFGTHWVEFRTRFVFPRGTDFFTMEYEVMYFNDRLKIRNATHPTRPSLGDQSAFGQSTVQLAVQVIRPYQIPAPRCLGEDIVVEEVV